MNKLAALVMGCTAVAVVGCSSDDDSVTITEPVAPTMNNYSVTFTNLSTGQPMTPPVVAIHDSAVSLFRTGTAASAELQAIAENGDNAPMVALAGSLGAQVSASGVAAPAAAGPILPQQTSTILLENG